MVSGRIDGWVTFAGIFVGIGVFTLTIDWFPGLQTLYMAGSGEVSLLHEVFGIPALVLAIIMVAGAVLAFVGAEKVEAIFQQKRSPVELTPRSRPRLKLAMGGSLAVLGIAMLSAGSPGPDSTPIPMVGIQPLELAERIIERDPNLLILDLRADLEAEKGVPGAMAATDTEAVQGLLAGSPEGSVVVVYDETGTVTEAPGRWPARLEYRYVEGGLGGWEADVLTAAEVWGNTLAERERVLRQNQISAFFSGAAVQSSAVAAPPPAMSSGNTGKKPKAGGC
jgi:rhodanese-related sulfurtransferase